LSVNALGNNSSAIVVNVDLRLASNQNCQHDKPINFRRMLSFLLAQMNFLSRFEIGSTV
jgi:hypothetical protein